MWVEALEGDVGEEGDRTELSWEMAGLAVPELGEGRRVDLWREPLGRRWWNGSEAGESGR